MDQLVRVVGAGFDAVEGADAGRDSVGGIAVSVGRYVVLIISDWSCRKLTCSEKACHKAWYLPNPFGNFISPQQAPARQSVSPLDPPSLTVRCVPHPHPVNTARSPLHCPCCTAFRVRDITHQHSSVPH